MSPTITVVQATLKVDNYNYQLLYQNDSLVTQYTLVKLLIKWQL